ncbi:hypothetical protein NQ317_000540 [Molorchus minor]|uniref:Uncharacterized protein n=1 Tax=Molorchus minor TaxID=1323400 RepID=A0ABQ9IZR1_9CUCU|nr:hypothetical protein NQ317_000540 [Molorchus minor]
MKAARNRRRARLGLPPEEEKAPDPAPEVEPTEEETKKQEEAKQKEEVEKLLETARKSHLRPWDIGKEGVKEHYEMTQEEWVEKMRGERPDEFAPPSSYRTEFRSTFKDVDVDEALDKSLKFTTKKLSKNKSRVKGVNKDIESEVKRINPYKYPIQNTHFTKQYENKFHKGSATSNKNMDDFKEIPQSAPVQPTSIENLCDFEFDDRLLRDHESCIKDVENRDTDSNKSKGEDRGRGVEIAPPPSFEYYGPGHSKRPRVTGKGTNIEESIDAGLKFLRNQYERKEKSTKHPREMFLS